MKIHLTLFVFLLFVTTNSNAQSCDSLALTPPMGWNSWNKFGCNVDEDMLKEMAEAMVESGMRDAGYVYLVIDDCWQVGRDSMGNILPDPERFPSGMKALGDYIHSLGLKFGIYSCAGSKTCQGRPGSRGYQFQDARTYASWNLDYDWKKQTMYFVSDVNIHHKTYRVWDCWEHKTIGSTDDQLVETIPPHGLLMVRLSAK